MMSARAYDAIASIRIDGDKIVWATSDAVYKLFWGSGGARRLPEEIAACKAASECRIWGRHCLPVEAASLPRLLRSQRGAKLDGCDVDDEALEQFLNEQLRRACAGVPLTPAVQRMELGKLKTAFNLSAFENILNSVRPAISGLLVPSGPVHGDLHRGNIVCLGGRFLLIDWDRYNSRSSPFFDKLHYLLTERRRQIHLRWLPLLEQSEDLISQAYSLFAVGRAPVAGLALAYGINRIALEAHDARLKGQCTDRFLTFSQRLLETFRSRALAENESLRC